MLIRHLPPVVTPAKAGAHPGRWEAPLNDRASVGFVISIDGWVGPRLRGDDGDEGIKLAAAATSLGEVL